MLLHQRHPVAEKLRGPAPGDVPLGLVLTAAAMAMFATNLDFFALNLSIPGMARELHVSSTDMQWAISGFMLALGSFLIPGGRLGDLLGRRRMLIIGHRDLRGRFARRRAGAVGGVRDRDAGIQGIGAAIMFPVAIAVVTNTFPEDRRKRAIGNLYGLAAAATAVGPFVGGGLTEVLSWRWVLLINVPVCAIAIALMLRSVPESRDETVPRQIDFQGLAAVALGIGAITLRGRSRRHLGVGLRPDHRPVRGRGPAAARLRPDRAARRLASRRPEPVSQPAATSR